MQATTTSRRFGPRQIKQAAITIAILTSAAIGVTTASIVRDTGDGDSSRAAAVTSSTANREQAFGYQFMEQNLNLPGSDIAPATDSTMDYRFLEMNLELPGTAESVAPDWRILEQNSWGEDFVLDGSNSESVPPSATDFLQKHTPESSY